MKTHRILFKWQLRTAAPALVAAPIAALWVLLVREPLFGQIFAPGLFIFVHSALIAATVGRYRTPSFAFLHSRGFDRQELFGHTMLAVSLLALAAWFPAALLVWSGARAGLGNLFGSPYQPIMWSREIWTPLWWLAGYICASPLCHYVWIRQAHQRRARNDANWFFAALVIALFCFHNVPNRAMRDSIVYQSALLVGGVVISGLIFWLSHRLHRQMEIGT